jgi:hypothetical protein
VVDPERDLAKYLREQNSESVLRRRNGEKKIGFSKILITSYQIIWHHIPEDSNFHITEDVS